MVDLIKALSGMEETHQQLKRLADFISGKKKTIAPSLKVTNSTDALQLKIKRLHPIDDFIAREKLKLIHSQQQALQHTLASLHRQFKDLTRRLCQQESIGLLPKFLCIVGGATTSPPDEQELTAFIEKVMQASRVDYGEEINNEDFFSDITNAVKRLSLSLGVGLKLKMLASKIMREPLAGIEQAEKELCNLISRFQEGASCYFSDLGDLNHPLNRQIWDTLIPQLRKELAALKKISILVADARASIKKATLEKELPSVSEMVALERLVEEHFDDRSLSYAKLKLEVLALNEAIEAVKHKKMEEAKAIFGAYQKQFKQWRDIIDLIIASFKSANDVNKLFPWRYLPPSQKEVRDLQQEMDTHMKAFQAWPCVDWIVPKKVYVVSPHYQRLLVQMKEFTEQKLEESFSDPAFSVKKLQHYIKVYQRLLIKGGYQAADEEIAHKQLKVFYFAYHAHRRNQFFSFFRRCYFTSLDKLSWQQISMHCHGRHKGYSGKRTREVLHTLGWLCDDELTELAPKELRQQWLMDRADSTLPAAPEETFTYI